MDSTDEDTRLARRLRSAGRLDLDQLNPLLERARRSAEVSFAGLLVSSGLISDDELEFFLFQGDSDEQTLVAERRAPRPEFPGWAPGQRVAGYALEEVLGRGGMGVVLRARHLATGRAVALKGLLYTDVDAIARFTREAQAQAAVDDHPNVVRVYEAGNLDGQCYLAMELLGGGDLAQRLKLEGGLPPREAAAIVAQLARGLDHVHTQGILHRDLKPQNVLFDANGTPKLVDFGLALVAGAERLTETGQVLGTPAYMAPEQAMGETAVDARTDVYGLGAILYACLTGHAPFRGELGPVLEQVVHQAPERPSARARGLDPGLEAVCLRALAKDPAARFPDAASLAAALEPFALGEVSAPPARSPLGIPLAALGLGLALGFLGGRLTAPAAPVAPVAEAPPAAPAAEAPPAAPVADPAPAKGSAPPPPPVTEADLVPWSRVMLPWPKSAPGRARPWVLGWVRSVTGEPGARQVAVVLGGFEIGPVEFVPGLLRHDGLGVGAEAEIAYDDRAHPTPCTIRRRLGPMALVEFVDGDRTWVPVLWLQLQGEGVDPGEDADTDVHFALWNQTEQYYPGVIVARDPSESRVRIAFLDGDVVWVPSEELRSVPEPGDSVFFRDPEEQPLPARFVRRLSPWVVEVEDEDGTRHPVDLGRLVVLP